MSGVIEAVGENVKGFKVGDPVFGCINNTDAAYVAASPEFIVKKPENISFEAAAAVSQVGLTAYQAISDFLKEGKLRVEIQQVFPMQEIAQAHQLIESHGVRGKIVIRLE